MKDVELKVWCVEMAQKVWQSEVDKKIIQTEKFDFEEKSKELYHFINSDWSDYKLKVELAISQFFQKLKDLNYQNIHHGLKKGELNISGNFVNFVFKENISTELASYKGHMQEFLCNKTGNKEIKVSFLTEDKISI